ncbi:MAG TPA: hypothetical protein RMH99_18425, partial [Sandaracinaceae bacterium LLY-WYZ-13_1]|nr:hypothetical protein [Sandaracinaceae bacterium LLY-WYZ-13_1]
AGEGGPVEEASGPAATEADERPTGADEAPGEEDEAADEKAPEEAEDDELLGGQWTGGRGLAAFVVAAFFTAAAAGAGFLAIEGSRALASAGRALPWVGPHHWVVGVATLVALGVLPATAVYRPKVVAIGAVTGGLTAAGGWYLFDAQPLLWDRLAQASAGGLAGFLAILLILGVLGGTRWRRRRDPKGRRP